METENTLLDKISSIDALRNAWVQLNKENEDSRGLSGITIRDFSNSLESNLRQLSEDIKNGSFKFMPTRAAIIKKDNGKFRPLQIPEVRDRVVLKSLAILLEEELKDILSISEGVSYAYQKGKGVREAVLTMKSEFQNGGKVILKADIINFFEEVNKDKLLEQFVYPTISDKSVKYLINGAMNQKLKGLNRIKKEYRNLFKNAGIGIPQGNPLSPLLSNVYLTDFDSYLKDLGYSLIRYADDFIVIFNSEKQALEGYKKICTFLDERFKLKIHPLNEGNGKTQIINPQEKEVSFLSIRFDGINIYPSKDSLGILKGRIRSIVKKGELNNQMFDEIYGTIEKWIAIYSYLDIERYFKTVDSFLITQLVKKFGKKYYKTTKCKDLAQNRREKQYDKSKSSFWRNPNLKKILPNFIRRKK